MTNPDTPFEELAKSYGVQTTYNDDRGNLIAATTDALAVLRVLAAPLETPASEGRRRRPACAGRRSGRLLSSRSTSPSDGRSGDMPVRLCSRPSGG